MNTAAIAAAIATRFSGVTATSNGITEAIVVGPTASLPNAVGKGPALLVFPPTGTPSVTMRRRADTLSFPVRLLRDPLNVPQRTDFLYAWYDALRDEVEKQMSLGLAYVAWAEVTEMELELDGFTYAGVLFDSVTLIVSVRLDEVVSTLGA
ncbi:MAG TPA: hypothetical protein VM285_00145 [Polyangia bacterium]|nr:hypothetical protein [Polyangia bacterium]HUW16925.1 hypothetical protein [Actinomycetes bacterium]